MAYRAAAALLVLFCAGHTAGGMLAQKSVGAAGDAVFAAMKTVHFPFNGASCTWYGFWLGLGLTVSLFLLLSAVIAWRLGDVAAEQWPLVSTIAWALVVAHLGTAVLSWIFFFPGAATLATVITLLLAVAALRKARSGSHRLA